MDIRKKLVIGTATLVALGGLGTTAAIARSSAPTKVASESVSATDPDNIQEGDQSSPDQGALAALATSAKSTVATNSKSGAAAEKAGENGEGSGENENSGESDGPGGHEDAPGQNVDYQFEGEQ